MVVTMMSTVFWNVTPGSLVDHHKSSGGICIIFMWHSEVACHSETSLKVCKLDDITAQNIATLIALVCVISLSWTEKEEIRRWHDKTQTNFDG
jgi:hypothetical protein